MSQVHRVGDRAVVVLEGDILALGARAVTSELLDLIDNGNAGEITLDLTCVSLLDSSGIGALTTTHSQARKTNGSLRVTNASDDAVKLFGFMRLDTHSEINARS